MRDAVNAMKFEIGGLYFSFFLSFFFLFSTNHPSSLLFRRISMHGPPVLWCNIDRIFRK